VLVAQKPGAACRWFDETDSVENIIRHIPKIIPQADDHPTVKPVRLMAHFIGLHTRPCDLVLDPFMGSATTAVAALRGGRRFLGVECDQGHFDHAVRRIEAELSRQPLWEPRPVIQRSFTETEA
jgi:site-specific DNA-methyltransferase (adenine-specific)